MCISNNVPSCNYVQIQLVAWCYNMLCKTYLYCGEVVELSDVEQLDEGCIRSVLGVGVEESIRGSKRDSMGGGNSMRGGFGVGDSMRGGLGVADSVGVSRRRSRASSSSLSCRRLLLARLATRWRGSNSRSLKWRTREQATKVSPDENSLPISTTALSRVRPWDLWMVTAQGKL